MPQVVFQEYRRGEPPLWTSCTGLRRVIETRDLQAVPATLEQVWHEASTGLVVAGFVCYEAAPAMDEALAAHPPDWLPLVWFGVFDSCVESSQPPADDGLPPHIGPWQPAVGREQYLGSVQQIKQYIAAGDTYQVNYTFPLRAEIIGKPWPLFLRMCRAQQARYCAYIETDEFALCSASPELFFQLDDRRIISRPMKGTSRRGRSSEEDRALRIALQNCRKNRAENAMIVDMVRNDLGRIAARRSVQVCSAFDVELYPTVLQMTSTVAAQTEASLLDIFRALFPPASVTGAPKVRTTQIIRQLEPFPRGVYTGCIGRVGPGRQARFSVAIRTLAIDKPRSVGVYGVGSGIVWDSRPEDEYQECLAKAKVLSADCPNFQLLETMLYDGREVFLLEEHLQRLAQSAEYFGFAFERQSVAERLEAQISALGAGPHRIRLLLARDGQIDLEASPLEPPVFRGPLRLRLAAKPVDPQNVFLYHKTTRREVYQSAKADGQCDDVILWNPRGEVTETTIANLVVELDGQLVTPPIHCGLLPGAFRRHLLETGQIVERVVYVEQLRLASRVFAVNSVRCWMPAVLV